MKVEILLCDKQDALFFIKQTAITMRETNFYPGIYKIIAVVICLMLFMTINKAKAAETASTKKSKTITQILTNP